ncbi:MAG: 16S rRNA (cytidine(1402)-2'-O)-methyltransferase [Nevskiales bacterium]
MPDTGPRMPAGRLFVVATPIGNLEDLSARARRVLTEVALIAAEDTRHSAPLLRHFGIATPLTAYHEHNEAQAAPELLHKLQQGADLALISDAGTPLVSDPGYRLVAAARAAGIEVLAVPGACAAVAALSISGLPSDRFVFEGFLPARAQARRERLRALAAEERTLVLYESSHRIVECLEDLRAVLGDERQVCLARELTKLHEQTVNGSAQQLLDWLAADANRRRGEFVLLLTGRATEATRAELDAEHLLRVLLEELPPAQAARLAAKLTGAKKKDLYPRALALKPQA